MPQYEVFGRCTMSDTMEAETAEEAVKLYMQQHPDYRPYAVEAADGSEGQGYGGEIICACDFCDKLIVDDGETTWQATDELTLCEVCAEKYTEPVDG